MIFNQSQSRLKLQTMNFEYRYQYPPRMFQFYTTLASFNFVSEDGIEKSMIFTITSHPLSVYLEYWILIYNPAWLPESDQYGSDQVWNLKHVWKRKWSGVDRKRMALIEKFRIYHSEDTKLPMIFMMASFTKNVFILL